MLFCTGAVDETTTELRYYCQARVGGKIAQMGSRLIDGTARKMADDFFAAMKNINSVDAPKDAWDHLGLEGYDAAHDAGKKKRRKRGRDHSALRHGSQELRRGERRGGRVEN